MWDRTVCPFDGMQVRASVLVTVLEDLAPECPQQWHAVVELLVAAHGDTFKYHFGRALLEGKALTRFTIDDQCFLMDKLGYIPSFLHTHGIDEWLRTLLIQEPRHLAGLKREAVALGLSPGDTTTVHALVTRRLARPEWGERFDIARRTRLLRLVLRDQEIMPDMHTDVVQCVLVAGVEAEALLAQRFFVGEHERVKIRDVTSELLPNTPVAAVTPVLRLVNGPNLLSRLQPYSGDAEPGPESTPMTAPEFACTPAGAVAAIAWPVFELDSESGL